MRSRTFAALLGALFVAAIPSWGGFAWWGSGSGSGIPTVANWTDLSALEPATPGTERLITNGIPGAAMSGRVLARRGASQWGVPGADATTISYLAANPIPLTSPTIPWAHQVVAKNFAFGTSTNTVGTLAAVFTGGSASAITACKGIVNNTGRTVKKVRILSGATTNLSATWTARVAVMGGGSVQSPAGSWAQVRWKGVDTLRPADGGTLTSPMWYLSDTVTIPGGLTNGGTLVLWETHRGGAGLNTTLPATNTSDYTSFYVYGYFAAGDYASTGASGTPTWQSVNAGTFDVAVDWVFDTNADPTAIINIVATGDSRRAEVPPVGQPTGDGWTQRVNADARSSGAKFRVTSAGVGGATMDQTYTYFQSLVRDSVVQRLFDVVDYEDWSWNSRYMGTTSATGTYKSILSNVKATCASIKVGLMFGQIAPPGQDNPNGTIPTDLPAADLAAYDTLTGIYPTSINVPWYNAQAAVWNTSFHRRHATSASSDNVHSYIGSAGQNLIGDTVNVKYPAILTTLGYTP